MTDPTTETTTDGSLSSNKRTQKNIKEVAGKTQKSVQLAKIL